MDNNYLKLKDRIVVVTGANGQLGKTVSSNFMKLGCKVIGIDLDFSNEKPGIYSDKYKLDIIKQNAVYETLDKIIYKFGKIDVLINNAGVSTFEPFEQRREETFDWVMNVNLKGTFNCIKNYVNLFDNHKLSNGSIINIGSIYGIISPDYRIYNEFDRKNSEVYGATKAGLIQMTKYFSTHLADRNIRCNAVSPGGIFNPENPQSKEFINKYSKRCPMKRMAKVDEIVGAIIYLASDLSSYTTGQNITIDGGMTAW